MATNDELAKLRRMTDTPPNDATYTDAVLAEIIDGSSSIESAAAQVWTEKAAAASGAVDMSESGSSRSLSQLQRNALAMAEKLAAASSSTSSGKFQGTVAVERA